MKKILLTVCLLLSVLYNLHAQRELKNPLLDSKEVIDNGVALYDKGKYKEAIEEYLKVPQSDTNYYTILHELILTYYKDSNFVEAERYANTALSLYPYKYTDWYGLLSNVYDDTQRSGQAMKAYDTVLAQNPNSYISYFNKGITLFKEMKYDEAEHNFQQCILIDPYYSSAHYFLGQLSLLKGNLVQAMMSFTTNLMVSPENRYTNNSVNFLNAIAEINNNINGYLQKHKAGKEDNFEDVQDIITSKVALDKKYELQANLEDVIVRQLQVMMEKLEYSPNDKGFWMQYYVPLFKQIWDGKQFEPMIFYCLSGIDVKKIKEYNQKEKRKVEAFSNEAVAYLNDIRESHALIYKDRKTTPIKYYFKEYAVNGKGPYKKDAKNEDEVDGAWEFYYTNGQKKSAGNFSNDAKRNGLWNFYYENGVLKESTNYTNDAADGKSTSWYDNGVLFITSTYKNDQLDGVETKYYFNGRLQSVINYKNGKKDGVAKYYSSSGYQSATANFVNNQQQGNETIYHANGAILSDVKYNNDLPEGMYKKYFDNGKLEQEGNYSDGKKTGLWKIYYQNGSVEREENYNNDELEGASTGYYENGKIALKHYYKKGSLEGNSQDFDDDGLLQSETIFERGHLRDIKFYDKKGTVISNNSSRNGNANIIFYDADGVKVSQGGYSKDGLAEGRSVGYYKNGNVSTESFYKNDMLNGIKKWYYPNNKLSEEGTFKNGKANGYFINYYINGQVSDEGWYVDDDKQGTFIYYDLLGNITSKIYYLNDNVHGISEYYKPNGKPDNIEFYDNGWFNKLTEYDSTGKAILTSGLTKGEGKIHFNHFNGKNFFESNYKYYKLNGSYVTLNADGSKSSIRYYKNSNPDSNYIAWYPSGKKHVEGHYKNGDKTGQWNYYYYDGQLSETEHYLDGLLDGEDTQYTEFGKLDKVYMFKKGKLNGEVKFYESTGSLMLVFYYKYDVLKGYSYQDSTGKMLPAIPLSKGSGVVDTYYKNGIKSAHIIFNEGVPDGERTLFFSNGKTYVTGNRINDLDNGVKKIYYRDGKLMKEENYYFGQPHGSFKYYNEDGSLVYDINYYLGSLNGDSKYYSAGKLTQTYFYYYDALEQRK